MRAAEGRVAGHADAEGCADRRDWDRQELRAGADSHAIGVPTIDADALVHEALGPGTAVAAASCERFGAAMCSRPTAPSTGARLAPVVFADDAARRDLEALVHPCGVRDDCRVVRGLPAARGRRGWALADIPLLFETGRDELVRQVIVAACAPEEQVRRVMARDGLSEADGAARLAAQWPIGEKVARADYVVWTDGDVRRDRSPGRRASTGA